MRLDLDVQLGAARERDQRAVDPHARDELAVDLDAVRRAEVDDLDRLADVDAQVALREIRIGQDEVAPEVTADRVRAATERRRCARSARR